MYQIRISFLFAFLLGTGTILHANSPQEDYLQQRIGQHPFDEQKWKSITQGIDYSKGAEKKEKPKTAKEGQPNEGLATFAKFLIIGTGLALLVWIFVKMADGKELFGHRDKRLKPTATIINLEHIEENLQDAELDGPIRQAAESEDYALAVRLHYLAVLKKLSLKKHIHWKRDKTNGEYLRELSGSTLFGPVQDATLVFERVWYGKAVLEREDYFKLETKFKTAVATIE